ncbi:hypothetical protein [Deinococcus sp. 6GRE01]|uniref:hypothetical protein n=1 Tax=Deinococcus sp. 6GRE01 TaxID=2745873 RepID=UPI001E3815CB|nr:hypothetical protein [Deinococcus sp. 6GRE01]MCD0155859.1 hypothetical protein [Deinococcus sp. 6GRE01]
MQANHGVGPHPKAQAHIDKADAIKRQAAVEGLTLDWRIICTYYSALHWLEALRCHLHRDASGEPTEVRTHIRRMAIFREIGIEQEILEAYVDLEALSRMARYDVSPTYVLQDRHFVVARNFAGQVINHARRELHQAGYRLPARR